MPCVPREQYRTILPGARSLQPLPPVSCLLPPCASPPPCSETYQYFNLPFCHPKEGKEYKAEGLGEVLEGDRLVSTPYHLKFREDKEAAPLCTQHLDSDDLDQFRDAVAEDYYFQVGAWVGGWVGGWVAWWGVGGCCVGGCLGAGGGWWVGEDGGVGGAGGCWVCEWMCIEGLGMRGTCACGAMGSGAAVREAACSGPQVVGCRHALPDCLHMSPLPARVPISHLSGPLPCPAPAPLAAPPAAADVYRLAAHLGVHRQGGEAARGGGQGGGGRGAEGEAEPVHPHPL